MLWQQGPEIIVKKSSDSEHNDQQVLLQQGLETIGKKAGDYEHTDQQMLLQQQQIQA